jgi:LmbE family N-acetylglucosaminyl deacetylase
MSPHFDDAILSAAGLMRFLVKSGVPVTVVNIFTRSGDAASQTLSAKKYLLSTGFSDPAKLYATRRQEDSLVLNKLGVNVINLEFTEALWRRKPLSAVGDLAGQLIPELAHIYPVYRWHITRGRVSPLDSLTSQKLARQLKKIIPGKAVVFCPWGFGNHVDHLLTRQVCDRLFRPVYWLDQPYYFRHRQPALPTPYPPQKFPVNPRFKKQAISLYKSQVTRLFKNGKIPLLEEIYLPS